MAGACHISVKIALLTLILGNATLCLAEDRPDTKDAKPAVLIVDPESPNRPVRPNARQPGVIRRPVAASDRQHPRRGDLRPGVRREPSVAVLPWPMSPYRYPRAYHTPYPSARAWRDLYRTQQSEFRRERMRRFNARDMEKRKQKLLSAHKQAVRQGTDQLAAGEYRAALISFTRAADLNHGDPACRIHLAQVRLALGHDEEAAAALRRALDLQPKLVNAPLNLVDDYPGPETFDNHVTALAKRVSQTRDTSAEVYFLLGFMEFQRNQFDRAHIAFRHAARDMPEDELTQEYLALTKPARP